MLSEQKEIAMQVSGMTCAACAARIEKGLKRMPVSRMQMLIWRRKHQM